MDDGADATAGVESPPRSPAPRPTSANSLEQLPPRPPSSSHPITAHTAQPQPDSHPTPLDARPATAPSDSSPAAFVSSALSHPPPSLDSDQRPSTTDGLQSSSRSTSEAPVSGTRPAEAAVAHQLSQLHAGVARFPSLSHAQPPPGVYHPAHPATQPGARYVAYPLGHAQHHPLPPQHYAPYPGTVPYPAIPAGGYPHPLYDPSVYALGGGGAFPSGGMGMGRTVHSARVEKAAAATTMPGQNSDEQAQDSSQDVEDGDVSPVRLGAEGASGMGAGEEEEEGMTTRSKGRKRSLDASQEHADASAQPAADESQEEPLAETTKRRRTSSPSPSSSSSPIASHPYLTAPHQPPPRPYPPPQPGWFYPNFGPSPIVPSSEAHLPPQAASQRFHSNLPGFLEAEYALAQAASRAMAGGSGGGGSQASPSPVTPAQGAAFAFPARRDSQSSSSAGSPMLDPRFAQQQQQQHVARYGPTMPAPLQERGLVPPHYSFAPRSGAPQSQHVRQMSTSSAATAPAEQGDLDVDGSPAAQSTATLPTSPDASRSPLTSRAKPASAQTQAQGPGQSARIPLVSTSFADAGEKAQFGAAPTSASTSGEAQGQQEQEIEYELEQPAPKKAGRMQPPKDSYKIDSIAGVTPFITKLRYLLQHPDDFADTICWSLSGDEVLVKIAGDTRLVSEILPKTFTHQNSGAFYQGQFTAYGFTHLKDPADVAASLAHPPTPSAFATGASGLAAYRSSPPAPPPTRDPAEWRVYTHFHTEDDYLSALRAERAAETKARRAKHKADGEEDEEEESSKEEEQEDDEHPAHEHWFSRANIDNFKLLGRLRTKTKGAAASSPSPSKAGGGGPSKKRTTSRESDSSATAPAPVAIAPAPAPVVARPAQGHIKPYTPYVLQAQPQPQVPLFAGAALAARAAPSSSSSAVAGAAGLGMAGLIPAAAATGHHPLSPHGQAAGPAQAQGTRRLASGVDVPVYGLLRENEGTGGAADEGAEDDSEGKSEAETGSRRVRG
ncbi:hypothetical protein JCM10207_000483 [Rhodosporidiobolus poonsookiae]